MWFVAVAGDNTALGAFHNLVSGRNDPANPGFWPLLIFPIPALPLYENQILFLLNHFDLAHHGLL